MDKFFEMVKVLFELYIENERLKAQGSGGQPQQPAQPIGVTQAQFTALQNSARTVLASYERGEGFVAENPNVQALRQALAVEWKAESGDGSSSGSTGNTSSNGDSGSNGNAAQTAQSRRG